MRHTIFIMVTFSLLAPSCLATVITNFDVRVNLERDSSFVVTEDLTVDFKQERRHGIFRRIPVDYERSAEIGGVKIPMRYAIRLRLVDVTNEQGKRYRTKVSREERYLMIRMGDPNAYVDGVTTYKITYRVTRAINHFDEHDEFYWNVTGNEWEFPIERASCTVTLPEGTEASQIRHRTFTGYYGSRDTRASAALNGNVFAASTDALAPGEGLTVVLGLPKGVLTPPGALQRAWWFIADNGIWIGVLLMPLIAFGVMSRLYLKYGRDPEDGLPVTVQYQPPPNLAPAEVGTLVDESADTADIVSIVLDLAVRGYLKIREVKTTTFLFFSNKDYEFIKLKDADGELEPCDRTFMYGLFRDGKTVRLSELKNKFYTHLPSLCDALYQQLVEKRLFPTSPEKVRTNYTAAAILVAILLGFAAVGSATTLFGDTRLAVLFTAIGASLLTGLIIYLFGRVMPRKTLAGSRAARHALGFKEFVQRVEKDRIERMAKEDPTLFERLLPYAVVLGVADEWAEKFRGLINTPPSWYESPSYQPGSFHVDGFVNDLGRGMHTMASTFTSAPSERSGGGGSSGFSSSGGFSGGGFGGGGGGSW